MTPPIAVSVEDAAALLTGSIERSCAVMTWLGCKAIELPDAGPQQPRRRWWR